MRIVSTFSPSSSVLSSVKCQLSSRDLEHLVIGKLNRLDVYSLRPHGLQHECSLNLWGKLCSVRSIRVSDYETRSNIALMLTHPDPEFIILEYKESPSGTSELVVKKQISLFERLPRPAEFFTDLLIHPSGKLAVASCYAGKLKVITFKAGHHDTDFDVSFPELNVLSLCFLPTPEDQYSLGILHIDPQERLQLCSRDVDVDGLELSPQLSTWLLQTSISELVAPYPTEYRLHLIPVEGDLLSNDESSSGFPGGVLVAGGKEVLLFELASTESQEKQRGKQKRLQSKLKSSDAAEAAQAKAKEQERGLRKRKPKASVSWPWNEVASWCTIDEAPSRFLIGDSFGRLSILSLDNVKQFGMIIIPLGEISPPTTLTYLANQNIYVGSHVGDSQLVQISPTMTSTDELSILSIPSEVKTVSASTLDNVPPRKGKEKAPLQDNMDVDDDNNEYHAKGRVVETQGSYINVLESYKNIAPIMDAISVDTDGSGQNQIVTCSGGANTGSVNVVRSGADFKESAFVQGLTDVTRIWSVRAMYDDLTNTHLLVSTVNESHLFRINDTGNTTTFQLEESVPSSGLITNQPTLAFSNFRKRENGAYCNSDLVVQVVPTGAHLLEWDTRLQTYIGTACGSWEVESTAPPNSRPLEIVAASINASQVALALSGGTIVVLCIDDNALQFKQFIHVDSVHHTKTEISAISFVPLDEKKNFSNILTVAYWGLNIVELFFIRKGDMGQRVLSTTSTSQRLPAVVRSLLLHNFGTDINAKDPDHHAYLLAGLGDGSVAVLSWKDQALQDLKIISLGHAPVHLTPCEVDGRRSIFAAGNRSSLFFYEKNRLATSPIILKDISAVCKLNTRTLASTIVLASPTGLSIGTVRNLNKMHIRSAFFGLDNPRKIVHDPLLKVFGVACSRVTPTRVAQYEPLRSVFHLIDDNSLARLGKFKTEVNEEIISVLSFKTTESKEMSFFCLGTIIYKDEEIEPSSGRLLVFTAHTSNTATKASSLELSLVVSAEVKGIVNDLQYVEGKIVAAVNSSVLLYHFEVDIEGDQCPIYSLDKLTDWNHNYLVTSLGSFGDRVIAGDQISSVSLLKVTDTQLVLEGRDFTPLYPVAVEALDKTTIMAANDTLNLVLFKLGRTERGSALERIGYFHLGELVSKFVRGSLTASDRTYDFRMKSELIFFTSSGSIGVIINVDDEDLSLQLTQLQENLAAVVSGIGGTSHTRFRAPKNSRGASDADGPAYGLIDGDFLEQYAGLVDSPDLNKVMEGRSAPEKLKLSEEEILKFLEHLQGLH